MATLFTIVQAFESELRDLIAFVTVEQLDGEASVRFEQALTLPGTRLRIARRIEGANLARQAGIHASARDWCSAPPIDARIELLRTVPEQIEELSDSLLLGVLGGLGRPLGPGMGHQWRLATHSGSSEEREAWMRGEPFLTASAAIRLLGVPRAHIVDLIQRGELPAEHHGNDWLINPAYLTHVQQQ
jgi:excisionase family DNA binding protein